MRAVKRWFRDNILEPMRSNGISISLRTVRINNTLKKPGPVFLEMARTAYREGAQFFYRVNDDTEFVTRWPKVFVRSLQSLGGMVGVVGPLCNQGNQKILTHDFVHRTHLEIFEMNYYPPELVDWWMDDWISFVYGRGRTFKARGVTVIHHTGAHGQRYEVNPNNEKHLWSLVEQGHAKIRRFLLKASADSAQMTAFDSEAYSKPFDHKDAPAIAYK